MTKTSTGRIIRSLSGFYEVQTADGCVTCRARGSLRRLGESPMTGDLVEISVERGKGMVEKILPRRNQFVRPAVANVDALVIFAANTNPVTEPFLIDRVAAIAGDQEVDVILCINKCDLDPAEDLIRIYTHAGFKVIAASAETGEGVENLRNLIRGKLVAFTGNSGVHIVDKCTVQTMECMTLLNIVEQFIFILLQHHLAILNFYIDSRVNELSQFTLRTLYCNYIILQSNSYSSRNTNWQFTYS